MATSRRGARWFCLSAVAAAMALLWLGGGAAHSADAAPTVTATWPEPGALDIPLTAATDGSLSVTFSEPVTLEVRLNRHARTAYNSMRRTAGFSASATLSRAAFGMKAHPRAVDDAVHLMIEAEAIRIPKDE